MSDPTPVGQLIDVYYRVREERSALLNEVKELNRKLATLELAIIDKLNESKLEGGRGSVATGSITETVVGTLNDYDKLSQFIYRHKKIHLLERRISSVAFREELSIRGEVPGVEPFTRVKLNVQKRSK